MVIVFGGSFNPPTIAHLNIVKKLLKTFKGSTVLILPVGDDYKKPELVHFSIRYEMLTLLFKDLENVYISSLESTAHYQGTLYSLNRLSEQYNDLYFVIGSDHLEGLKQWIKYEELLKTYPFIVMNRKTGLSKEEAEKMFEKQPHCFTYVDFESEISSSTVRNVLDKREEYLTKEVHDYIIKNHLYQE